MRLVGLSFLLLPLAAMAADLSFWTSPVRDAQKVAEAERALRAQGYEPGVVDGKVDERTRQAVRDAQQDRELEPTGRLDRRTVAALGIDVAPNASSGGSALPRQPR